MQFISCKHYKENPVRLEEESNEYNAYLCDKISQWFFHHIDQPISILDFGCGKALLTYFIQRAFFKASITAVDKKTTLIQKNQKKYPNITFMSSKNTIFPFDDCTFDLIYTSNVMHHIRPPDHKKMINELMRIVKPMGSLIIIEFNPYNLQTRKIFRKEHDSNTHMVSAGYFKNLLKRDNYTMTVSYLYPNSLSMDTYCNKIPFGPLYALHIIK